MQLSRTARFSIRRLKPLSLLKYFLVLGFTASVFPSLIATLAVMGLVSFIRRLLESGRTVSQALPAFGWRVTFDFVDLLKLSDTYHVIQFVDERAWLFGGALFAVLIVVTSVTMGIAAVASALVYNVLARAMGGIELELEEVMLGH